MKNKRTPDIRFAGFTEEWEQRKLGELIEISSASRVHKNEWTKSGVRFFRSSDVVSNFNGKKNIPAFISFSLYDELSKKSGLVQPGDILVTGGGSIGIPYLVVDQEPLYFKDADLIWLKSANKIDGYFLYFYFVTPQLRKYISSITHIGTISHYTIEQAKDTPIILPERVEQTLVGNFLKQLDDTIALHQQELTTLKQTKQGFLQKMFPKEGESVPEIRFPGFTGDWEQRKLGQVVNITMGQSPNGENYTENPDDHILVQGNADIKNGWVAPRVWTTQVTKSADKGDIILSVRAPVGDVGKTQYDVVLGRGVAGIKGNEFIFQSLSKMKSNGFWTKYSTGSTFESINSNDLKEAIISVPGDVEQIKIGNFFKQLDDTITLYQRELDALKETKKAFLQKMFA
ncbi:type I restriction endonuclease subunit S [Bacillus toyonensis]|uniref:restriction endonuclease subunit S n=1 Tax=Bacillus toyonensis TaxID=155322 RepID=UPI000BFBB39A|nr:restriction endonuclease subunit S [Bacillus toyonensis]PHG04746.1 type I restriction endonuclease subunit S [Bacillus toyonensis]